MTNKMPSPLLMQHSPFLNNDLFLSPSPTVLSLPSLPKLLPYNMELRDLQLEDAPGSESVNPSSGSHLSSSGSQSAL